MRVGKITPAYGAAFQNVVTNASGWPSAPDGRKPRVTALLEGRVHVIHAKDRAMCAVFNRDAPAPRQVLVTIIGHGPAFRSGGLGPSVFNYSTLRTSAHCDALLVPPERRYCLVAKDRHGGTTRRDADESVAEEADGEPLHYIRPAALESYDQFLSRCGALCKK